MLFEFSITRGGLSRSISFERAKKTHTPPLWVLLEPSAQLWIQSIAEFDCSSRL